MIRYTHHPSPVLKRVIALLTMAVPIGFPLAGAWQATPADPADSRPGPAWEAEFADRMAAVAESKTWSVRNGNQGEDAGKGSWSPLLAEVWKKRDDPAAMLAEHEGRAFNLFKSSGAGSFYKPFSVPGYSAYYFRFKDHVEAPLPASVADYARNRATTDTSWNYLSRPDRYYDILYRPSLFNSENFNWMMRLGGVLWAFGVDDRPMGAHPDEPGVDRGNTRAFYTNYLNNLTRALFNAGRVEWNSNNYWSHSFTSVMNLYDFAPNAKMQEQAQAIADWMVMETALHFVDGAYGAADVRAKSNAHRPYAGSIWSHAYAYFVDAEHMPTYPLSEVHNRFYADSIGYLMWSSYRPPRVAIDIARRAFALPVEIQSAKPFYYLDNENYADWAGDTVKSRRFEFETLYLDDNYLLSSLATYRADRDASIPTQGGFFTEQGLWRIVAKGGDNGGIQVAGNAGPSWYTTTTGRHPREQIGQQRNVMMRVFRSLASAETLFKVIPTEAVRELDGDRLYVDLGNGVYFAVLPFNAGGVTVVDNVDVVFTRYRWTVPANELGALVLEMGVARDHGDFAGFKAAVAAGLAAGHLHAPAAGRVEYTSTQGHTLTMEYVAPGALLLNPGSWSDGAHTWTPAGVPARVWRDGVEVDYATWDSYRVVEGEPIIHQEWGSGVMQVTAGGSGMEIRVDPDTAGVQYFELRGPTPFDAWAAALPEGQRGRLDDPFNEGMVNILRYALGGEAAPGFARPSFFADAGAAHLFELELRADSGVRAQLSEQLHGWTDAGLTPGAEVQVDALPEGFERLRITPPGDWDARFLRLMAEE
jgi:hypothetical protein